MNIAMLLGGILVGFELHTRGWSFYCVSALIIAWMLKKAFTRSDAGFEQFGVPATATTNRRVKKIVEILGSADKRGRLIQACVEKETPDSFFVTPVLKPALGGTTVEVPKVKVRVVREIAA